MPGARLRGRAGYCRTDVLSAAQSYTTTFSATENPLSEGGNWASVFQRTNFQSTGGYAVGKQTGANPPGGVYDDSIMCMSFGTWTDTEIVLIIGKTGSVASFCEIEAIIRCNAATGQYYEVNLAWDGAYCNAYLAEGGVALANFTPLATETGGVQYSVAGGVHDGDWFRVRMVGDTITAEISYNAGGAWTLIATWTDTSNAGHAAYASGRPGIGAFISDTGAGPMANYKINSFSAVAI